MRPAAASAPARDIHLCSGIYKTTCTDIAPVEVLCQTVVIGGASYVWIDGVDTKNPTLLPVQALHEFRRAGTLRQYLDDPRHADLDEFDDLITMCRAQEASATLTVRACEIMHKDGVPAEQALKTATEWGDLFNQLGQTERAVYEVVVAADKGGIQLH